MRPLYNHQLEALIRMEKAGLFALCLEPGCGKTAVCVTDWLRRPEYNLLVVAPAGVYLNWRTELKKFVPEDIYKNLEIAVWVSGGNRMEMWEVEKVTKFKSPYRKVFLANVEAFSTVKALKEATESYLSLGKTYFVVDESTRIKNHGSKRTKVIVELGKKARVKRILSGLITPRSPMDLFSQFLFLDPRILGYRNFYSFRAQYGILKKMSFGGRQIDMVVGYKNLEQLQKKIESYSYRVLKENCLDLPPKIYTERSVELSSEQLRVYKSLLKKATAQLDDDSHVTATTALSLIIRLHQVLLGHVRDEQDNLKEIDAEPRERELMSILEETEGKVIIFCPYRATILRLRKLITEEYGEESLVEYWGDTTPKERVEAILKFEDEKSSVKYFLGNPSVSGLGITLVAANTVVYYGNGYDLEHRVQSEDRAHRIGQKKSVTYIDLVSKDTVDEKIIVALKNKINLAASLTGEKIREWLR